MKEAKAMTISRNAPCICGSGKKYKKCCLGKENQGVDKKANESNDQVEKVKKDVLDQNPLVFQSDIDILSNSVIDLIESKDYGKAKEVCGKLLDEYPDHVDGYERLPFVHEAEGDTMKAAEFYRKTADFMRKHPGFDSDGIDWYVKKADELEKKTP